MPSEALSSRVRGRCHGSWRNLVVPALYVVDDATLDWLAAYAHAGGHPRKLIKSAEPPGQPQ
jgi:hypothetical protein